MKTLAYSFLSCVIIMGGVEIASAAYSGDDEKEEKNPFADLDWKVGPTSAKVGSVARQDVGEGYLFLEASDARKFLELNQNPSDESNVGVILSKNWWASYSYADIGYVSDDEKDSLDSDAILKALREGTKAGNAERRRRGWPELELVGWARKPHYDEKTHNLEWATKLSSADGLVVNYNTRILGRGGVMSVTLVCDPEQLSSVLPQFKAAMSGFGYTSGNRYFEYRKGDRAAEVGLSALILGGAAAVAAKSGAMKWVWKGLVVLAIAIGGFFKKIFGKGKQNQ
jgi:uncharacterized membrane-anchored protein